MRHRIACTMAAVAIGLMASPSAADAASCHGPKATKLFLEHGISNVTPWRVGCPRAVRRLDRWADNGMRRRGPRGWKCRRGRISQNDTARRHRCRRGAKRLRFDVGE